MTPGLVLLLRMAWRNIWRNPVRSSVVFVSMGLGVWAGLFLMGWASGINDARVQDAIDDYLAHGHVHVAGYTADGTNLRALLPNASAAAARLEARPDVRGVAPRLQVPAMVQAALGSSGLLLQGVDPQREAELFTIPHRVPDGAFLADTAREFNGVVVGQALANRLDLRVGDPVVFTYQDTAATVHSTLYTVEGLYDGTSNLTEEAVAYVRLDKLATELGVPQAAHDLAFRVDPSAARQKESLEAVCAEIQEDFPAFQVKSWRKTAPEMGYVDEIMAQALLLFMGIMLLAMAFGILNTMLMAILERQRELGMLMAVGLTRQRVFALVVLETVLLTGIGLPFGLLLGHATLVFTNRTGISLEAFADGLAEFGISPVIYPQVVTHWYLPVVALVFVLSLLASLMPARKAVSLNPIESMRAL
jgi:ABC-type lipoprotein release transport system permease subunit